MNKSILASYSAGRWVWLGVLSLIAFASPAMRATPLTITTMALSPATGGVAYDQALAATGGATPYTWTIQSGGLPSGLSLNSTSGHVAGTSATASWIYSYPFTIYAKVTDANGAHAYASVGFKVIAPAGGSSGGTGGNTPPPPPPASAYSVTVVSGTLTLSAASTGNFASGTTVSITAATPPPGQAFQSWTGNAPLASSFAAVTNFTMPAGNVTVTATFYTPAPIPQPVTTHPRLWVTPADLPKLQSWANANNPIYQLGLKPLLTAAVTTYNTQFFPGGVQNPNWPDLGDTQGYQGLLTEQHALLFAFNSLIDPSPAARIQHAQRARNLIMVAMNEAVKGALVGAPFRDPLFAVYNRGNFASECWPLVVDWIYDAVDVNQQPILTAADKATIRTVFLRWSNDCLHASTTGGDHPAPIGLVNSPALVPGGAYRMAANNYYLGHARLLTLMSLSFDPADDPAVNPNLPLPVLGNSLRSYITDATGAWLYQQYAMFGEPAEVTAKLGLPAAAKTGLASGGLPPEGMLYGHSFAYLFGELLALKTAGFADPAISGPQVALANNAPVWDRFVRGMITSLTPTAKVSPAQPWLGPIYQVSGYGDTLRTWITPDFAAPFALLGLLDQQNGDSSRLNAERWWVTNAVEGGAGFLLGRVSNPWTWGLQDSILYFLLLDPAAPAATDPRPGYATAFYDAPQGRLVEATSWSPSASMFDFRCSWISINHQQADANQFGLYRNGEWLTKGVTNYDNNIVGLTSDYHNTLSLKNWCVAGTPVNLGWWEPKFWSSGSQWQLGGNAGDPTATVSVQASYTYTFGDTTNLYNKPSFWQPNSAALDILHASRSLLWLKPDHIVVYDRATSKTAGLFKRFNLALTAVPSLVATPTGNVITTTTPVTHQHLYLTPLLPASATFTSYPVGAELNPIAQLEPSNSRIVLEDPANPADVRFLNVLEGADQNKAPDPVALVQSSAGTAFDGALIGDAVVMFKRDVAASFTSVTYAVPDTTAHHYITGLAPNTGYTVTTQSGNQTLQITIIPGGVVQSDSAGVLLF